MWIVLILISCRTDQLAVLQEWKHLGIHEAARAMSPLGAAICHKHVSTVRYLLALTPECHEDQSYANMIPKGCPLGVNHYDSKLFLNSAIEAAVCNCI
jgi:hypothetical protein